MRVFAELTPVQLTPAQSVRAFRYRLDRSTVIPPYDFKLPVFASVQQTLRLEELLTEWKDETMDGFRLAEFRNFPLRSKIKELTRSEGRITWSADVEGDALQKTVTVFSNFLGNAAGHFVVAGFHTCFEPGEKLEFEYSLDLYVRLLRESLVSKTRPRLLPRVQLAPWDAWLPDLRKMIPRFPWVYEDFNGRMKVTESGAKFVLESFGERGERELHVELATPDQAICRLVDELLGNHVYNSRDITFNPTNLRV
jgi:hypothetical protein